MPKPVCHGGPKSVGNGLPAPMRQANTTTPAGTGEASSKEDTMIGQVDSNVKAIDQTSIRQELAATEAFDIDETPRPAAGRCTGTERITELCIDCYVPARG